MAKSPQEIREELMSTFVTLYDLYQKSPKTSNPDKISYIDIEMAEHLMNSINDMMYHYMEDVPEMRVKRKWGEEMVRADKLLKKYAEDLTAAKLKMKKELDTSGYLENRDFFGDAVDARPKLKRKMEADTRFF